ncbi:hypothetical protein EMCRGX_G025267 [Ephydatia muelleri]
MRPTWYSSQTAAPYQQGPTSQWASVGQGQQNAGWGGGAAHSGPPNVGWGGGAAPPGPLNVGWGGGASSGPQQAFYGQPPQTQQQFSQWRPHGVATPQGFPQQGGPTPQNMQGQFAAPQSTFQTGFTPTPQGTFSQQGATQFPQGAMQFPPQGTTQFPQQVPQGAMPFPQQGVQQGAFVSQGMLSQQALQAQQMQFQQRQQALILEQQVKAENERKRREFEQQRQKLASMDFQSKPVLNPLTELFGKKPAATSSEKKAFGLANTEPSKPKIETPPKSDTSAIYEKLMVTSLTTLEPRPEDRAKRTTPTKQPPPPQSTTTESEPTARSRAWTQGTDDLAGLFSQHATSPDDDGFGDFQSMPPPHPVPLPQSIPQGANQTAPLQSVPPPQPIQPALQPPHLAAPSQTQPLSNVLVGSGPKVSLVPQSSGPQPSVMAQGPSPHPALISQFPGPQVYLGSSVSSQSTSVQLPSSSQGPGLLPQGSHVSPSQPPGPQPLAPQSFGMQPPGPQPLAPQSVGMQPPGPQPLAPQSVGMQPPGPQPLAPQSVGMQAPGPQPLAPQNFGVQPPGPQPLAPQNFGVQPPQGSQNVVPPSFGTQSSARSPGLQPLTVIQGSTITTPGTIPSSQGSTSEPRSLYINPTAAANQEAAAHPTPPPSMVPPSPAHPTPPPPSMVPPSPSPVSLPPSVGLDMSRFPPLYGEVCRQCAVAGDAFVSTEKLFPLLVSSQLPKDVLRELWSLVNKTSPGRLTQLELCILLGLIGLVQNGKASPVPADLKQCAAPPVPTLTAIPNIPEALSPGTPIISHVPALEPIVASGMGAPGMGDITPIVGQQTIPQQQSPSLQLVGLGTNQGPPPQLAGLGTSQGPPPQLAGLGTSQGPPSQLAGLGTSQGPPPQLAGLGTSQGPRPQLGPSHGASVQLVPPQGMLPSQTVGAAATVPGPSATKLLGGPTFAPLMSGSALLMPGSTPLVTPTMTSKLCHNKSRHAHLVLCLMMTLGTSRHHMPPAASTAPLKDSGTSFLKQDHPSDPAPKSSVESAGHLYHSSSVAFDDTYELFKATTQSSLAKSKEVDQEPASLVPSSSTAAQEHQLQLSVDKASTRNEDRYSVFEELRAVDAAGMAPSSPVPDMEKEQLPPNKPDLLNQDMFAAFQEVQSVGSSDVIGSDFIGLNTTQLLPATQMSSVQPLPFVGPATVTSSKTGVLSGETVAKASSQPKITEVAKPATPSGSIVSSVKGNQVSIPLPSHEDDFFAEFADFKSAPNPPSGANVGHHQFGLSSAVPLLQTGPSSSAAPLLQTGPSSSAAPLLQTGPSSSAVPLLQTGPIISCPPSDWPLISCPPRLGPLSCPTPRLGLTSAAPPQTGPSSSAVPLPDWAIIISCPSPSDWAIIISCPTPSDWAIIISCPTPSDWAIIISCPTPSDWAIIISCPTPSDWAIIISCPTPSDWAIIISLVSQSWEDDFDDFKSAPTSSLESGSLQQPPSVLKSSVPLPSRPAPQANDLFDLMSEFSVSPHSSGELLHPSGDKDSSTSPGKPAPLVQESSFAAFGDFESTAAPSLINDIIQAAAVSNVRESGIGTSVPSQPATSKSSFPQDTTSTEFSEFADFTSVFHANISVQSGTSPTPPISTSVQSGPPSTPLLSTSVQSGPPSTPLLSTSVHSIASVSPLITTPVHAGASETQFISTSAQNISSGAPQQFSMSTANTQPFTLNSAYVSDLPEDDFDDFRSAAPLSSGGTGQSKPLATPLDINFEADFKTATSTTAAIDDTSESRLTTFGGLVVSRSKPPTNPAPPQSSLDVSLNTSFDASFDEFEETKPSNASQQARSPSRHSGESLFFEGSETLGPSVLSPLARGRAPSLVLDDDVTMPTDGWGDFSEFKTTIPSAVSSNNAATLNGGDDWGDFTEFKTSAQSSLKPSFTVGDVSAVEAQPPVSKSSTPSAQLMRKEIWEKCLTMCCKLMSTYASVLSGVKDASILRELVNSEAGVNRLRGACEVYKVAKRIHCSAMSSHQGGRCESLFVEIKNHWRTLSASLPGEILGQLEAKSPPIVSRDGLKEESIVNMVTHRGHQYHTPCANFWNAMVKEDLPVL